MGSTLQNQSSNGAHGDSLSNSIELLDRGRQSLSVIRTVV